MVIHCLAFISLSLLSLMVNAAPLTPIDRDLIRERQRRLLDGQRKSLEDIQRLPGDEVPTAFGSITGDIGGAASVTSLGVSPPGATTMATSAPASSRWA